MEKIRFYQNRDTFKVYAVASHHDRTFSIYQLGDSKRLCGHVPNTGHYLSVDQKNDYIKESRRLNKNNSLVLDLYKELSGIYGKTFNTNSIGAKIRDVSKISPVIKLA